MRLYLDYASAMPVSEEALSAMRDAEGLWANPGALHAEGVAAKQALEAARSAIALELAVKAREIVFTSGLTESNNLAILGLARALESRGRGLETTHWITSSIEHDAVLESFAEIERRGGFVTHVDPDERGYVSPESIVRALRPETVLVSIGWANSETGTLQPLRDIARAVREARGDVLLHSDAGQAPLYLSPQVHTLGADLFALGSNKLGGPHGIGALYVSNRSHMRGILVGGKQERSLRAGTENVALAAGFAAAFKQASSQRAEDGRRVRDARDALRARLEAAIPGILVNTGRDALPHMLNISIPDIAGEYVMLALDAAGIAVSTKSACREGEVPESHVVKALGGPEWRARNTLRLSIPPDLGPDAIARVAETLRGIVESRASRDTRVLNVNPM